MKTSAAKWILAAALLWSQVVFAEHQFEHAPGDLDKSCVVCVQLDRDDGAFVNAAHPELDHCKIYPPEPTSMGFNLPVKRVANYRSRASP